MGDHKSLAVSAVNREVFIYKMQGILAVIRQGGRPGLLQQEFSGPEYDLQGFVWATLVAFQL